MAHRVACAADPPFLAVAVAVTLDAQPDVGRIATRSVRLGHDIAAPHFSSQQRLQPLILLRLDAVLGQQLHVAHVQRGLVCSLGRGRASAKLLAHEPVLEICEACALFVVTFCKYRVSEAWGFRFGFRVVQGEWMAPAAVAVARLRFTDGVPWYTFLVDKLLDLEGCQKTSASSQCIETYNVNSLLCALADQRSYGSWDPHRCCHLGFTVW